MSTQHYYKRGFDAAVSGDACPDTIVDSEATRSAIRAGYEQGLKAKSTSEYLIGAGSGTSAQESSDDTESASSSSSSKPSIFGTVWVGSTLLLVTVLFFLWVFTDKPPFGARNDAEYAFYCVFLLFFAPITIASGVMLLIGLFAVLGTTVTFVRTFVKSPLASLVNAITVATGFLCVASLAYRVGVRVSRIPGQDPFSAPFVLTLFGSAAGLFIGKIIAETRPPGRTSREKITQLCIRSALLLVALYLLPWQPMLGLLFEIRHWFGLK